MELEEEEILPFEATEMTAEKILVVAPHPDDEVIGCGGLLALHADSGRRIRILICSDGTASLENDESRTRRDESRRGLDTLGVTAEPRFLGLPDRELKSHAETIRGAILEEIRELRPDLILVPSPIDIHPDHSAVCHAIWSLFQENPGLGNELGNGRVALYETSQAILPTDLVDITPVAERKFDAIRAHQSQMSVRDYEWFARGLAQYRALTLPSSVRYAEAYSSISPGELTTSSWSTLVERVRPGSIARVTREPMPVTVLVRTKDRLNLLAETLDSIETCRRISPDVSVVVVNDGGESPASIVESHDDVKLLDLNDTGGRSEAMNRAAREAKTPFICFLDDDDLYFPEHVSTLRDGWDDDVHAVYSDAVSSFWTRSDDEWEHRDSLRIYSQEWDSDLLIFDNYVPLPTLMMKTETWHELGGFDPQFDLFEDWDLLIRLSKIGHARHVPRVTCEIRSFEGGDAITQRAADGSKEFERAKVAIWEKHAELATLPALVKWQSKMKGKLMDVSSELAENRGRAHWLETKLTQANREREQTFEKASESANQMGARINTLQDELARASENYERIASRIGELETELRAREETLKEREHLLESHFAEIAHLNGILDQIYASKTWKLHTLLERIRGEA